MIHVLTTPDAGVVYTKPWMVALILDLAGYTADRDLATMVSVEPSAGDGAFLEEMVRRLVASCHKHGTPLAETSEAIRALMSAVGEFFIHCYGVRMRGVFLRFQAKYLRRIRAPNPDRVSDALKQKSRDAFDRQDFALATSAALKVYGISAVPR